MTEALTLVLPSENYLASYKQALQAGWSPDNIQRAETAKKELSEIASDPKNFIARKQDDRDAKGGPVTLPDGTQVDRLPSFVRWLWDGEFCGSIGFRWKRGTANLPPHVLGHIGYSVIDCKQGRGYATKALALMLKEIKTEGLPYVELTTDPDNIPSQKVIIANKGIFIERFAKPKQYGDGKIGFRYRIML